MMRLLVDEYDMQWERAWDLTRRTISYTNHTLLPEALERWPAELLQKVLPRHLQIIYEINHRFLEQVAIAFPGDTERLRRMSIIDESGDKQVRMAHLAIVGSHAVNGVAKLHSELLRTRVFKEFCQLWPRRFQNKTNGVTQRRWLLVANPRLTALLRKTLGDGFATNLEDLRALEPLARDAGFADEFRAVKRENKRVLAKLVAELTNVDADPDSIFDVQAKRIHLYKRQLLHVLFVIHEYLTITEDGKLPAAPRTHVFAGKAAPGYAAAKQVIKLIHSVGSVVNHDKRSREFLKVAFLPDYRVSLAERIIPGADLSEQISTAGMEASGTGNMKFAMNGALTIGTLDGANIEIREEVGEDNVFIFGLRVDEIEALRASGLYKPAELCAADPRVARVVEALKSNLFCAREPGLFQPIHDWILDPKDEYLHLADLTSYIAAQAAASELYTRPAAWTEKAILNVARVGAFSSDRTIREYARDIWDLRPTL
jgi:starch phosphorylase